MIWLFLAVGIAFALGGNCIDLYRLSKGALIARGVVREKKPHFLLSYTFEVKGRSFGGTDGLNRDVKSFDGVSVGDEIVVHYLAAAPEINCLGDPQRVYPNECFLVIVAMLLFPTLIVGVGAWRLKRLNAE